MPTESANPDEVFKAVVSPCKTKLAGEYRRNKGTTAAARRLQEEEDEEATP
jgi:hypothetical protein